MISNALVAAYIVALVMTTAVPLVILLVLGLRRRLSGFPLLTGAAGFVVAWIVQQMALGSIASAAFGSAMPEALPFWYVAASALIAAVLGGGILLGTAFALPKNRKFKDVMSVGLGYGLAETVLIVGLNQVSNVNLLLTARQGTDALLAKWPEMDAAALTAAFADSSVPDVYLGLLERLSLTVIYLWVALMLYQGVVHRSPLRVLAGFGGYALFLLAANLLVEYAGRLAAELVMLALAAGAAVLLLRQARLSRARRLQRAADAQQQKSPAPGADTPAPPEKKG